MSAEVQKLAQMLIDTPEVVEADRATGEDCFLAKLVVSDVQELETEINRSCRFHRQTRQLFNLQLSSDAFPNGRTSAGRGVEASTAKATQWIWAAEKPDFASRCLASSKFTVPRCHKRARYFPKPQ